jgi:LPS sulfotransferase NodH
MVGAYLIVKTARRGSDWEYRVLNGGGQTLACRRFFKDEAAARLAGQACANAIKPGSVKMTASGARSASARAV